MPEKQEVSSWTVTKFSISVRRAFLGYAKSVGKTAPEALEEALMEFLKKKKVLVRGT